VPGDIKAEEKDASYPLSSAPATTFYAFDANEVISYSIDIKQLSKYYWAPNEDSVYNYWKDKTVSAWSDSVLSYTTVTNGGIVGREIISINKYDKNKSRYRLLLNGRQMYVLGAEMDGAADRKNNNSFFEQFRITNEKKSNDIFTTTTEKLFTDLQSKTALCLSMPMLLWMKFSSCRSIFIWSWKKHYWNILLTKTPIFPLMKN
jgi:hypothetical protein